MIIEVLRKGIVMEVNAFYNTTHLSGNELKKAWSRAGTSTGDCWVLFKKYGELSPWQAYGLLWKENGKSEKYPITSVRRALHTLERNGKIRKTGRQRIGKKTGAKENIFSII